MNECLVAPPVGQAEADSSVQAKPNAAYVCQPVAFPMQESKEESAYVAPPASWFFAGGFATALFWFLIGMTNDREQDGADISFFVSGLICTAISAGVCALAMLEDDHPLRAVISRSFAFSCGMIIPFVVGHLCGMTF